MGMAIYYLTAVFPSEEEAEEAMVYAKPIVEEIGEAEEYWQKIRDKNTPAEERHMEIMKEFPLVEKALDVPEPPEEGDSSMNYLAGELAMDGKEYRLSRDGNEIYLNSRVWHLASWDNIADLFRKLGAVEIGWLSDEHIEDRDLHDIARERGVEFSREEKKSEKFKKKLLPCVGATEIS